MATKPPYSAARTQEVVCKIILFYSVFYVVMKLINIFSRDGVLGSAVPNLVLCIPFAILGLVGFRLIKINTYSWFYVGIGVIAISAIRYFNNSGAIIVWLSEHL